LTREDLFGENGACNGCWCMDGRIGSAYRRRPREKNRAAFREVVKGGPPPSASGSGYASTFARAGFRIVARRTPARPIMRHDLKASA
jgi:hypothetical protein